MITDPEKQMPGEETHGMDCTIARATNSRRRDTLHGLTIARETDARRIATLHGLTIALETDARRIATWHGLYDNPSNRCSEKRHVACSVR